MHCGRASESFHKRKHVEWGTFNHCLTPLQLLSTQVRSTYESSNSIWSSRADFKSGLFSRLVACFNPRSQTRMDKHRNNSLETPSRYVTTLSRTTWTGLTSAGLRRSCHLGGWRTEPAASILAARALSVVQPNHFRRERNDEMREVVCSIGHIGGIPR